MLPEALSRGASGLNETSVASVKPDSSLSSIQVRSCEGQRVILTIHLEASFSIHTPSGSWSRSKKKVLDARRPGPATSRQIHKNPRAQESNAVFPADTHALVTVCDGMVSPSGSDSPAHLILHRPHSDVNENSVGVLGKDRSGVRSGVTIVVSSV